MICYDDEGEFLSPCSKSGTIVCSSCYERSLNTIIETGFQGYCPIMFCPFCTAEFDKRHVISFSEWSKVVSPPSIERQNEHAKSLLSFQCSSCHSRKSLLVDHVKSSEFNKCLVSYQVGDMSIQEIYSKIQKEKIPPGVKDSREAWKLMAPVLAAIEDPERRSNLQLRYLRDRPEIYSNCCTAQHCFKCRTRGFHTGKRCEEMAELQNNDILSCSQCAVLLTRGDGCDSVTCVCGNRFSWSGEMTKKTQAEIFYKSYPHNTKMHCVLALCCDDNNSEGRQSGAAAGATSWSQLHTVEFNDALLEWWVGRHGSCAVQAAALLSVRPSRNSFVNDVIPRLYVAGGAGDSHKTEFEFRKLQLQICAKETRTFSLLPQPPPSQPQLLSLPRSVTASSSSSLTQSSHHAGAVQFLTLFGHCRVSMCDLSESQSDGDPEEIGGVTRPPRCGDRMTIKVKDLTGKVTPFIMYPSDTAEYFTALAAATIINMMPLRFLVFKGRPLDFDDRTLLDHNINEESLVYVVFETWEGRYVHRSWSSHEAPPPMVTVADHYRCLQVDGQRRIASCHLFGAMSRQQQDSFVHFMAIIFFLLSKQQHPLSNGERSSLLGTCEAQQQQHGRPYTDRSAMKEGKLIGDYSAIINAMQCKPTALVIGEDCSTGCSDSGSDSPAAASVSVGTNTLFVFPSSSSWVDLLEAVVRGKQQ